jgi:hypothetical protein
MLLLLLLLPLTSFLSLYFKHTNANPAQNRDQWLLNLSYGHLLPHSNWTPLNKTEESLFTTKADAWLRHSLRRGIAGHIQFGQVMPQVLYEDPNMTIPSAYDDVGDAAAWTGHLLASLVHKYYVDEDSTLLPIIMNILKAWDFHTHNCTGMHGFIPRSWATPDNSKAWLAFRNYFTPSPPYINGNGTHGVYNCSVNGNTNLLWQGGSSRDTYIGIMFGLGSAFMTLEGKAEALEHYTLAQTIFERIFDKLSSDLYFIVYPLNCLKKNWIQCVPVNPTPTFVAVFERVALFVNPKKYLNIQEHYDTFLKLAIETDSITPLGHSGYYGNNLLSECWYIITRMERLRNGKNLVNIKSKISQLLVDYRSHLQANLNAYWVAAVNNTSNDIEPWNT